MISLQLQTKDTKHSAKLAMHFNWKPKNGDRARFWLRINEFCRRKKLLSLQLLDKLLKSQSTGHHHLFQTKKISSIGSHGSLSKMCPSGWKIYNPLHFLWFSRKKIYQKQSKGVLSCLLNSTNHLLAVILLDPMQIWGQKLSLDLMKFIENSAER